MNINITRFKLFLGAEKMTERLHEKADAAMFLLDVQLFANTMCVSVYQG